MVALEQLNAAEEADEDWLVVCFVCFVYFPPYPDWMPPLTIHAIEKNYVGSTVSAQKL